MSFSNSNYRPTTSLVRRPDEADLTPLFIPRLSELRELLSAQERIADRIVRARRIFWAAAYVVGFGSGLFVTHLIQRGRAVPEARASAPGVKERKPKVASVETPVVTIREVER